MTVRKFKDVRFKGDWENNYIGKKWNLRVGRSQVALWRDYKPVFCWLAKGTR